MPAVLRRELDPQPQALILDQIKVYEVKGHEVPLSQLPSGRTQSEWTTLLEEVRPQDFIKNFQVYRCRVMANLRPKDVSLLKQLETQIVQNP